MNLLIHNKIKKYVDERFPKDVVMQKFIERILQITFS